MEKKITLFPTAMEEERAILYSGQKIFISS